MPNVTGFNGAKKARAVYELRDPEHFCKIVFKPALMGGKHEIITVDKQEILEMGKRKKGTSRLKLKVVVVARQLKHKGDTLFWGS